jgi:uncharacterized repeat protein (TIGR03803 family)
VFRLSPHGSNWNFALLHSFGPIQLGYPGGAGPFGLAVGKNGVLYGGTAYGGAFNQSGQGTIYSLTPAGPNQPWNFSMLYVFTGAAYGDGAYPFSGIVIGNGGVLYGATQWGGDASCNSGSGCGTIFELAESGGVWTDTILHEFEANGVDGNYPNYGPLLLRAGDLYGMTGQGGADNDGVAYAFHP